MTVDFYTFSKRENSTARPSGSAAASFSCTLKDRSGVLRPVLEIYNTAAWNPTALNYAHIAAYGRYYYVTDWTWIVGRWECTLEFDALASWKTNIGATYKYILRCASEQNVDVVDTYYPSISEQPVVYADTRSFGFSQDFSSGVFVLGVANQNASGAGAISYYTMSSAEIRQLVAFMLPTPTDAWTQSFTSMTDTLFRAIYSPFDYIKSCIWFPWAVPIYTPELVRFGNYLSPVNGQLLNNNAATWPRQTILHPLPSNWSTVEAKYRTSPYCHMYVILNPWGVIELNPLDFAGASDVALEVIVDYISGDAQLRIYRRDNLVLTYITQKSARLGVDINLSTAKSDPAGAFSGLLGVAGGIAAIASGGAAAAAGGILTSLGGVASAAEAMVPSASGSVGQTSGGIAVVDGISTLRLSWPHFADPDPAEIGYPLLKERQISSLSGYVKCSDGDISAPAYAEELSKIAEFLTGGFFYE